MYRKYIGFQYLGNGDYLFLHYHDQSYRFLDIVLH